MRTYILLAAVGAAAAIAGIAPDGITSGTNAAPRPPSTVMTQPQAGVAPATAAGGGVAGNYVTPSPSGVPIYGPGGAADAGDTSTFSGPGPTVSRGPEVGAGPQVGDGG